MKIWTLGAAFSLALIGAGAEAQDAAVSAEFTTGTHIRFVQADEAAEFLGATDDFVAALGEADLLMRFGDAQADYAERAAAEARDWTAEEISALENAIELTRSKFETAGVALPLPQEILLIKTTTAEEANAGGYTRGNAIVLGERGLGRSPDDMVGILAHELFHVATHYRSELRDPLYAAIGFEPCALTFPPELEPRRVTNPDAFHLDHCIAIERDGAELTVTPIILLREGATGAGSGSPLDALEIALLSVGPDGAAAADAAGRPVLIPIDDPAYLARIGGNTGYIIHPEEIMAENFSALVRAATDLPNPEILDRVEEVLAAN